jgi:hypothetical protein
MDGIALQLAYDPPRTIRGESGRLWAAVARLKDMMHVITSLVYR